ncbi:MAG: cytochrome b N-terminal domain-containing protein [Chloroflexi bacterium]|nr:cytochrome b N-terminal domain-containing protein [Chloroflexota bacterium]
MVIKISNWLDERIGWRTIWETVFKRNIPRVNWLYTLGSATLLTVFNQAITGILLTIYYVPTPDHAYDSVQYITNQVTAGWLIRGLHHWGASAMVILSFLHMLRVIFMGSYKFPREVTWFSGVLLFLVTIGFGFTGYLLPWDQKAYWATTVGTRIVGVIPGIGDWLLKIVRGGEGLSSLTLSRFFGVHIWILPAILIILLGIHLFLVISIGISEMPQKDE